MNVILLEKLPNLGDIGTVVKVKAGYARNFLLPTKKAQIATPENIKDAQNRNAELLKSAEQKRKQAEKLAQSIAEMVIVIPAATDDEGHLYGSVGIPELVAFFQETECPIEKRQVALTDGAFKTVGEHDVQILLHPEVSLTIKIKVEKENATN